MKKRLRKTNIPISVGYVEGIGDRVLVLKATKEEVLKPIASSQPQG